MHICMYSTNDCHVISVKQTMQAHFFKFFVLIYTFQHAIELTFANKSLMY